VKIPVTEQIVKYYNHATLKIAYITFLYHSDIHFGVQEIVLTKTTPLNALKQLPCDWLIT